MSTSVAHAICGPSARSSVIEPNPLALPPYTRLNADHGVQPFLSWRTAMTLLEPLLALPTLEHQPRYVVPYVDLMISLVKENPAMIVVMRATATDQNID